MTGGDWLGPARSVAKGATWAFNDEIEGLARMLMAGKLSREEYNAQVGRIRAQQAAYEEANPLKSLGYEAAGAVLPALIPGGQAATAGRLASLAAKYPRARAVGDVAADSIAYGIGSANSMSEAPRSIMDEMLFGLGIYGAGKGAAAGGKKVYNRFKVRGK